MTKVRMQRFILYVRLDDYGGVVSVHAQDNWNFDSVWIDLSKVPEYVLERIALMKLTGVNKSKEREVLGRKLEDDVLILYLNHDEYHYIKEECK
jgi:hypothetical protein